MLSTCFGTLVALLLTAVPRSNAFPAAPFTVTSVRVGRDSGRPISHGRLLIPNYFPGPDMHLVARATPTVVAERVTSTILVSYTVTKTKLPVIRTSTQTVVFTSSSTVQPTSKSTSTGSATSVSSVRTTSSLTAGTASATVCPTTTATTKPLNFTCTDPGPDSGPPPGGKGYAIPGNYTASSSASGTNLLALTGKTTNVTLIYNNGSASLAGRFGNTPSKFPDPVSWQASGVFLQGGCDTAVAPSLISDCYFLGLTGNASQQLASGYAPSDARQRVEIFTTGQASDRTWRYTWKSYLVSPSTTTNFFHMFQILSRGNGTSGPFITLDAQNGRAILKDTIRCPNNCTSVSISAFAQRAIQHDMLIQFGDNGTIAYTADDIVSGKSILTYNAWGWMGNYSTSLKFGEYRKAIDGMTDANSFVGDFVSTLIASS